jgi:hypothetical protein
MSVASSSMVMLSGRTPVVAGSLNQPPSAKPETFESFQGLPKSVLPIMVGFQIEART